MLGAVSFIEISRGSRFLVSELTRLPLGRLPFRASTKRQELTWRQHPWKIAVSGFYKTLNFMKVGQVDGKPVMMDDTIYFLPCQSEAEADFILELVRSQPFAELLNAMVFDGEKRPITAELLKRISLELAAEQLGRADEYAVFTGQTQMVQLRLALGS